MIMRLFYSLRKDRYLNRSGLPQYMLMLLISTQLTPACSIASRFNVINNFVQDVAPERDKSSRTISKEISKSIQKDKKTLAYSELQERLSAKPIIFVQQARKLFWTKRSNVDWSLVQQRWRELKKTKESLANKYFTPEVLERVKKMSEKDQQRFLTIIMGGLCNRDSSVGVYVTRPQDYDVFAFYLQPIIREYHHIEEIVQQQHNWNTPHGKYLLTQIDTHFQNLSMRARVARNVKGWFLPSSMDKAQRLSFEDMIVGVFERMSLAGKYFSLTPGHNNYMNDKQAQEFRKSHLLFNDMNKDNHLTSSGVANDWPHGRGMWLSDDRTQMVWVGEEDHLRLITIFNGTDLALVDQSLHALIDQIERLGISFVEHPAYGFITICPTNIGTGKRESILGEFPNISQGGKNQQALRHLADKFNLQARGVGGQHSNMDTQGKADISPSGRYGITQQQITQKLYQGLKQMYLVEKSIKAKSDL